MNKQDYIDRRTSKCPECDGDGLVVCECCGNGEVPCEECHGTGLNDAIVDTEAWAGAKAEFQRKYKATSVWWIGTHVFGRRALYDDERLSIAPFIRAKVKEKL